MRKKILIVEDEEAISNLIKLNLTIANYETEQVYDGEKALELIEKDNFDLILMDVMIPKVDGFTIMKRIRFREIPVIFLTAKKSVEDKVMGLRLGAEDYIVKPFETIELLARIETVLRRFGKSDDILTFRDITIYMKKHIVKKGNQIVDLTKKEYELLCILVQNENIALSRGTLLEKVWSYDFEGESRTVDMHIRALRKKLDLHAHIKTVYKVGYRLER
ncbi:response regulator transcription factor [Bacillus massiliigorillae]|uniref:response regulator transcription factor n=1 Tax=Bacillus massiliigorillae TaxID=1243664 RepID=UPI0005A60A23|nr:response regulator transcription factor [Bacillus massiliigorillae]